MKEDLEFDIEGEIFEHFMTLQNFYKIFQDSLGIVQFIFLLQVHTNSSNQSFNGKFYVLVYTQNKRGTKKSWILK